MQLEPLLCAYAIMGAGIAEKKVIDTKYFSVTYITVDGEHEYRETGVLSAPTMEVAEVKAERAKMLFERPGWEEFCECDRLTVIPKREYQVLKKYIIDVDRYFNADGS